MPRARFPVLCVAPSKGYVVAKRKLSDEEREAVRVDRTIAEQAEHLDSNVTVTVEPETDEDDRPIVRVERFETTEMPKDWKPR